MKKILFGLSIYILSITTNNNCLRAQTVNQTANTRPEVGRVGKAFQGEEGLKVFMVRVGKETENEVLIQLTGIDHEWNNKIFKAKIEIDGSNKYYQITRNDNSVWNLIISSKNNNIVFVPNYLSDSPIYYNESLSSQMNSEWFLTDYLKQEVKTNDEAKTVKTQSVSNRPEVGRIGKAFQGEEGLKLFVSRIGKETESEVLIQLTGIDHEWNNKIFKAKIEIDGSNKYYQITRKDNSKWNLVVNSSKNYIVFVPNYLSDAAIYYNESLSSQMNPEWFLTDYLKQEEKIKDEIKLEKKSNKK